jgi:hypothetical protein
MREQNNRTSLACDAKLNQELTFLSKMTKKPKIEIIRQVIEPMVFLGSTYSGFTYDVMVDRNTVLIAFYGHSNMISGRCTEEFSDSVVDAKLLDKIEGKPKKVVG